MNRKDVFAGAAKFSYIKEISIFNLKCFGKKQTIKFSKHKKPSMWNMILGENGTGKSTILKAIVISSSFQRDEIGLGHDEYSNAIRGFSNTGSIELSFLDGSENLMDFKEKLAKGNIGKYLDETESGFPLFAYGSYRNSGSTGLSAGKRSQIDTLFDEEAFLINSEDWFLQSDYRDKRSNTNSSQLTIVKELLLNILDEEVSDIRIEEKGSGFIVKFKTRYGWVRFHDLSSGYRSLITWVVDLLNWLTIYYPESKDHCSEPAIVLVDEIDLHLHVSLQRKLVEFLTSKFPNIQFIVTAHSPLVIQGSQDENIILLERVDDQVVVSHNPINVKNWRVDQILTSDLFGLETARSLETEKKLKRRTELLTKDSLDEIEQKEMRDLESFMIETPYFEDKEMDEASRIIRNAAATLKRLKKSS